MMKQLQRYDETVVAAMMMKQLQKYDETVVAAMMKQL